MTNAEMADAVADAEHYLAVAGRSGLPSMATLCHALIESRRQVEALTKERDEARTVSDAWRDHLDAVSVATARAERADAESERRRVILAATRSHQKHFHRIARAAEELAARAGEALLLASLVVDEPSVRADERAKVATDLASTYRHMEALADKEDERGDKERAYIRRGAANELRHVVSLLERGVPLATERSHNRAPLEEESK